MRDLAGAAQEHVEVILMQGPNYVGLQARVAHYLQARVWLPTSLHVGC